MTKVKVNSGNCGYSVLITAQKVNGTIVEISLESECGMVMNMLNEISLLDMRLLFTNHIVNPVYRSAAMHLKHTACPVPFAILKAAEVALDLCVPENVNITFIKE